MPHNSDTRVLLHMHMKELIDILEVNAVDVCLDFYQMVRKMRDDLFKSSKQHEGNGDWGMNAHFAVPNPCNIQTLSKDSSKEVCSFSSEDKPRKKKK